MEAINRQSKTSVHFHMGYVLAMGWTPDKAKTVDFQKALMNNGLDFAQTNVRPNSFTLFRNEPSPLQVRLEAPGPQVSSIQMTSRNPSCELAMFIRDASAVTIAYQQTWPVNQYQIVQATARIGHVYSCKMHAFQYLWEKRLGQSPQDFRCLGKSPVAGGGLRLLMPPQAKENQELHSVEIRLESFLREAGKILVETTFVWPQPKVLREEERFEPANRLEPLEEYAANEVWTFLTEDKSSGQ